MNDEGKLPLTRIPISAVLKKPGRRRVLSREEYLEPGDLLYYKKIEGKVDVNLDIVVNYNGEIRILNSVSKYTNLIHQHKSNGKGVTIKLSKDREPISLNEHKDNIRLETPTWREAMEKSRYLRFNDKILFKTLKGVVNSGLMIIVFHDRKWYQLDSITKFGKLVDPQKREFDKMNIVRNGKVISLFSHMDDIRNGISRGNRHIESSQYPSQQRGEHRVEYSSDMYRSRGAAALTRRGFNPSIHGYYAFRNHFPPRRQREQSQLIDLTTGSGSNRQKVNIGSTKKRGREIITNVEEKKAKKIKLTHEEVLEKYNGDELSPALIQEALEKKKINQEESKKLLLIYFREKSLQLAEEEYVKNYSRTTTVETEEEEIDKEEMRLLEELEEVRRRKENLTSLQ